MPLIGDGECEVDEDCVNPEFNMCDQESGTCTWSSKFPVDEFPNNKSPNYNELSRCCRRRCMNKWSSCGLNDKGCKYEEDCNVGLKCSEDSICVDIDECDTNRTGLLACGSNANCINDIETFRCECQDGYDNFIYGKGCSSM